MGLSPERKIEINGKLVCEFYWHGEYPVYVDHKLVEGTFDEVVFRLNSEEEVDDDS